MIKVSVVLPVYNGEQYLEKSIVSVLSQTYMNFELIIVNDGSTDGSGSVCDKFSKKDSRIKVVHKKNEGLICARITGIEAASGSYIAFVDADDWVDETFLEHLIKPVEAAGADIVISGCISEVNGISIRTPNLIPAGIYEKNMLEEIFYPKMLWYKGFYQFGIQPYLCTKFFRKGLLEKCYMDMDTRIYDGEDVAVVYPYLLCAKKAVVIKDCMYHYRIHENSMSAKKGEGFYENICRLYIYLNQQFKASSYYDVLLPQLNQYMRRMLWIGMPKEDKEKEQQFCFPFGKIEPGSDIVLYGAGGVGIKYYQQLKRTKYCNIVSWVDKRYFEFAAYGASVESPDVVCSKKYDSIVIANAEAGIREEIKKYLIDLGVREEQIVMGEQENE